MINQNLSMKTTPLTMARVVTPGPAELDPGIRMVTIGGEGVLVFEDVLGVQHTTALLPAGSYPVFAVKILAGTTATDITGWA